MGCSSSCVQNVGPCEYDELNNRCIPPPNYVCGAALLYDPPAQTVIPKCAPNQILLNLTDDMIDRKHYLVCAPRWYYG